MALPEALVDTRKYAFRASRSLEVVWADEPSQNLALGEARDCLRRCITWLNEYTEEVDSRDQEAETPTPETA